MLLIHMQGSKTTRVGIIAESRIAREGLSDFLNRAAGIRVITALRLGPNTLGSIADAKIRVLLMRAESFAKGGIDFIAELHVRVPHLPVILFAMAADEETFLQSANAGIAGYLPEETSLEEVADAVRSVVRGEGVCPAQLCLVMFNCMASHCMRISTDTAQEITRLSRRERELIPLMSCGLSNKEIADRLNLSDQTVKHHVHNILQKLGVKHRSDAVQACRKLT